VKSQNVAPEGSLVKEVLQRSLRKSLIAASPVVSGRKRQATPSSSATVQVSPTADDASRKPLRSILHNSGTGEMSVTVQLEHLHETDSASKTKTRYTTPFYP